MQDDLYCMYYFSWLDFPSNARVPVERNVRKSALSSSKAEKGRSNSAVKGLNPTVAVIVDTRRVEYLLTKSTVLRGLEHWGMPYRIIDLAATTSLPTAISRSGVVMVGQEYLGESLGPHLGDLIHHIENGAALVNLDYTLFTYPDLYRELIGMRGSAEEISVDSLVVTGESHPILSGRTSGPTRALKQPVPAIRAVGLDDGALLAAGTGESLLRTQKVGRGKIVQWLVSPKLWNQGYLGFAQGLDGLLWRSIAWAAPKPFCMNAMPPFVRFRFDDCNGHWREPADLAFVDELNRRGHTPSICFCLRALTPAGASRASELQRAGKIDLAPHTHSPGTSLFFGDSSGEYSTEKFREIFAELDDARRKWGVNWSTILSDHEHEWSPRVVPFLRERGIRHKMNILLPGERWNDPHIDWRPGPYGSMSYALDRLPGNLSDFFVVFNHHPSFDSARVYAEGSSRPFFYHRPGGFGHQKWDFLNGLVRGPESRAKDLGSVVDRLVEHTRIGVDSLFFGGSISHSHFTRHLSKSDWVEILDRSEQRLKGTEQIPASYDEIADYAEARAGTRMNAARAGENEVEVRLSGRSSRSLQLSVYNEADGELVRTETEVPAFEHQTTIRVPA